MLMHVLTLCCTTSAKFSPEFLEERQFRLQRFLKGIILHPEMGQGGSGSIVGSWVLGDRQQ